jgi:excisionase family DNA binding protein
VDERHNALDFLSPNARAAIEAFIEERISSHVERTAAAGSPWLNVEQAAVYIAASPQRIYDLLSAGRIPKHKDGRRVLIRREDLDAYLLNGVATSDRGI